MRCRSCGHENTSGRLYCNECGGSLAHFVGREREVEALRGALGDVLSGRGRLLLLAGEPGIGKTRTAEEFATYASRRGARVLWGRCHEGEGAPAFWPWLQVIRAYAQADDAALAATMGAGAGDIAQLVPEVRERLPECEAPPTLEPAQARFRLFDSIAHFLRAATTREPLVIVLDDLHWGDKASLLLLQFLVAELGGARLLVLGAYRDTEVRRDHPLSATLTELARSPVAQRILLRGLPERDVARLIELLAHERPSAPLVASVHRQTEGNPFFVSELVPLLVAGGHLASSDPTSFGLVVPQGVREVIGRRLNGLSAECNRVLTLASVVGRGFDFELLEQVADLPADRLLGVLEEAVAAHVVVEVPRAVGRYLFSHALVRETLYEELPSVRRVRLHRRIGEVLEHRFGTRSEVHLPELAYHFFEAVHGGDVAKATDYATRAGARAMDLLAYEEAATQYERALLALDLMGEVSPGARCDLLLARGEAEMCAAIPRARETFLRAADVARKASMSERLARAALGFGAGRQGFWGHGAGLVDEALVGLLEEALRASGTEDSGLRALLLCRLAVALYWSPTPGRRAAITSLAAEGVAMANRVGDPTVQLTCLIGKRWADWRPDNVEERLAAADGILRLAQQGGSRDLVLAGHALRLVDVLECGDLTAADPEIEAFARLAEELRQPLYIWWSRMFRSMRALLAGRFAEAEQLSQEALAVGERVQPSDAAHAFAGQLFTIRKDQGRLGELTAATGAFSEQWGAIPVWRCALAFLFAEMGRLGDAHDELDRLAALEFADFPRDLTWLLSMALLAEAAALLADAQRARLLYDLLLPYGGRWVVIGPGAACWGSISRCLGLLATTLARFDDAGRHFEDALAQGTQMRVPTWIASTQHDHATMLLAREAPGDRRRALALLGEALEVARELGMTRLADKAEALIARARGVVEGATPGRATFRREGQHWLVAYEGAVVRLKDAKGLGYIAHLLSHPDEELDAQRLVGARQEGGAPPSREAARLAATKGIRAALRKIRSSHPALGRHLAASIRTGNLCAYAPPRDQRVTWVISGT